MFLSRVIVHLFVLLLTTCLLLISLKLFGELKIDRTVQLRLGRQRGRVVRASDLKSVSRGFKSRSDH